MCCKKPEGEQFLEWVIETALVREIRKLASAIKEKDSAFTLLNNDLQEQDNRIQVIQHENVALEAQSDVYQAEL